MNNKTVFTFWEPEEKIIPYLKLCMETWEKNLPGYKIIVLNHQNIDQYISKEILNISILKRLPLMMQKDAVMVAVLKTHGGIFMDADTIVFKDINHLVQKLDKTEMIMFSTHCGFVTARKNSFVLNSWLQEIQQKLELIENKSINIAHLGWDYLSNGPLVKVIGDIIFKSNFITRPIIILINKIIWFLNPLFMKIHPSLLILTKIINRLNTNIRFKIILHIPNAPFAKYLTMLDREKHGFMLEIANLRAKRMHPKDKYIDYWFKNDAGLETVLKYNPAVVGLHNSWTPEWYKKLNEKEVLEKDCLLSKTLKYLLNE